MDPTQADDIGRLILRVTLGVLILFHGVDKVVGGVGSIPEMLQAVGLPGFVAYGAYFGEVVGPLLLIAGWYGRVGAGLIVVNMLFAIGLAHRGEFFQLNDFGGWALELQGMYLLTAAALAFTGPGRLSVNGR